MRHKPEDTPPLFSFQKILIFLFTVIFTAIIALGITSYNNNRASYNAAQLVKHTQTVIDEADKVLSLTKDVQLESNGFVITGDSSFLNSYNTSKISFASNINVLRKLTADNSLQQSRVDSLQLLANNLIATAEQFNDSKNNQTERQSLLMRINRSKDSRDDIRRLINEIKSEENKLLAERVATNEKSVTAFKATFFSMLALIFLLMNIIFFVTRYNFRKQKNTEQKLRTSEEKFRLLVNNVKDYAIFMLDASSKIINWNKGAENIYGYTAEEIIGKPVAVFYVADEAKKGVAQLDLVKAKVNGKYQCEGWRVRRDGSKFWADVIFTAIYDEEGELKGFTNVTRDNTERRKADEGVRKALEKEKDLNAMKSNFVSIASHEFRTPLSTILSSVFLLEKYTGAEQQQQRLKHIDRIKSSVQNLLTILDDFLSLEKIEEGKIEQKIKPFNLRELSYKIVEEMKTLAKQGQKICYDYSGEETVLLDPVFVRHILNNLISNAIKYSKENDPVSVAILVRDSHIAITVKDNGIGISKEDQEHLFERFFRASNTVGIQGTGLGLHIVKHYVDMLNGKIKMNSELGKGSEFVVELSNTK